MFALDFIATNQDNTNYTNTLSDSSNYTYISMQAGQEINFTINSDTPAQNVYLMFSLFPDDGFTLYADGVEIKTDISRINHNLTRLEPENFATQFTLQVHSSCIFSNAWFFDEEIPDFVQEWEPPLENADILVVSTHADDEVLFLGAVMAQYASDPNVGVQVAYMVNHNTQFIRNNELLNGLYAVGIRNYPIIPHFPDVYSDSLEHAMTIYNVDEIIEYHRELIEMFSPQVIIGHDLKGEYGHGAHMLTAYALTQVVPETDVKRLYLHLYEENKVYFEVNEPLEYADEKTAFELCYDGYQEHKSQHIYYFAVHASSLSDFGLYYSSIDTPPDNIDAMYGIKSYKEIEQEELQLQAEKEAEEKAQAEALAESERQAQRQQELQEELEQALLELEKMQVGQENDFTIAILVSVLVCAIVGFIVVRKKNRK